MSKPARKRSEPGKTVRLRKNLERVLRDGHPWIFRDALEPKDFRPGDEVTVTDRQGRFVARGIADRGSIGVRVWTLHDRPLDARLFESRIDAAARLRDRVIPPATSAYRLLHGEGDRVPGLTCDVYAGHAVVRFDGEGLDRWRSTLFEILEATLRERGANNLLLRAGRQDGASCEPVFGRIPKAPVDVEERGMLLRADLVRGQKTGLFLDHRESRFAVRRLADGLSVLNLYGYTGGFSVAAGLGGARATQTVDIAREAIELARQTWALNALPDGGHLATASDVPAFLERSAKSGTRYDLVIVDPPSFAPRESDVPAALRGYRGLHRAALQRVEPGGYYLAASCSSHVRREDFEGTLQAGARQAKRVLQVLERWGAPADHPRLLAFPEGDYLKVVLARVLA